MSNREWEEAEQRRDEEERMQQCLEALKAAERAGTPKEYIEILAYESGVGSFYNRRNA